MQVRVYLYVLVCPRQCVSECTCVGGQVCDSVVNGKDTSCGVSLLEPQFYHVKMGKLSGELD